MIIYVYRDFMIYLQVFLILFQYYPSVSVGHLADLSAKEALRTVNLLVGRASPTNSLIFSLYNFHSFIFRVFVRLFVGLVTPNSYSLIYLPKGGFFILLKYWSLVAFFR